MTPARTELQNLTSQPGLYKGDLQINSSLISFELLGVPDNWSNSGVWSRAAAIAQHIKMSEWTGFVVYWGTKEREKAGWQIAELGHSQRLVTIQQYRHGLLDDDNLYASVKPLLDGCQTQRRRNHKTIAGAGLIWKDNVGHCHLQVEQELVPMKVGCYTRIIVERFDGKL